MEMELPLISPVSRKYYLYAEERDARIHHRAIDMRICLEYVCDEIVIQFVSNESKQKWEKFGLHHKIEAAKHFMDSILVDDLLKTKALANKGAHEGEEGDYSSQEVDQSLNTIKKFSMEIFYSYFIKVGFGNGKSDSWIPTVFSTLPPIYRVEILSKYYLYSNSIFVIDKLSKAYLKSGMKKEGLVFLSNCLEKNEISYNQFLVLKDDLDLLEQSFHKLPIAKDLEAAKKNFNTLLPIINEEERDAFVCLVSMILNGAQ